LRFPGREFCAICLCRAVIRFKEEMTLVPNFVRFKPDEITRATSRVMCAKLCDQVTLPKFRPRDSA